MEKRHIEAVVIFIVLTGCLILSIKAMELGNYIAGFAIMAMILGFIIYYRNAVKESYACDVGDKEEETQTEEKDYKKYNKKPNWEWIKDIANDDNYCDEDSIDIEQELCKAIVEMKNKELK